MTPARSTADPTYGLPRHFRALQNNLNAGQAFKTTLNGPCVAFVSGFYASTGKSASPRITGKRWPRRARRTIFHSHFPTPRARDARTSKQSIFIFKTRRLKASRFS